MDSSVGTGQATNWMIFLTVEGDVSLQHSVKTGTVAHPIQVATWAFSTEIWRPRRESDHSPHVVPSV
jgi:hypothetical protein